MNQTINQPAEVGFTVRLEALEGLGLNLGLMIYEAHGGFLENNLDSKHLREFIEWLMSTIVEKSRGVPLNKQQKGTSHERDGGICAKKVNAMKSMEGAIFYLA